MSEAVKGFSVVNHVGITVSNLDESVKFYEALTGTKSQIVMKLVENGWPKHKGYNQVCQCASRKHQY